LGARDQSGGVVEEEGGGGEAAGGEEGFAFVRGGADLEGRGVVGLGRRLGGVGAGLEGEVRGGGGGDDAQVVRGKGEVVGIGAVCALRAGEAERRVSPWVMRGSVV